MNIEQHEIEPGGCYFSAYMIPYLFDQTDFFKNYTKEAWGDHGSVRIPLVYWLDEMRDLAGHPINIHCCCETEGHRKDSYHPLGMAVDIHVVRMSLVDQLLLALKFPFNGVGVYPFWNNPGLHVDLRPLIGYKRLWYRDRKGTYHNLNSIDQIR